MIRRLLMVVLVAVFALLLGTSSTSATTESLGSVPAYTYDNLHLVVAPTHATNERGPPASYYRETDYDAADRSLDDASARTNGAKAWPTTTDTTPALVVQIVRGTGTTEKRAQADAGLQRSPAPAGVAAKSADDAGEYVYRIHGGEARQWGHSWTTENPLEMANPRSRLGLPKVNSGENVTCARVCSTEGVIRRDALPLDGNPGGGPELLFPNPEQQLQHMWTVRPDPPL